MFTVWLRPLAVIEIDPLTVPLIERFIRLPDARPETPPVA
jgi:hypothetical protein